MARLVRCMGRGPSRRACTSPRRRFALRSACAAIVAAAAFALPASASAQSSGYLVGAATVGIDPGYPVIMGGYGGGPAGGTLARHVNPLTGRPEEFSVRAVAFVAGGHVVELARVDSQGYYAGYMEGAYGMSDVRSAVGGFLREHGVAGAGPQSILISALHQHASPTIQGIWGPPQHGAAYLAQVAAATTRALEQAFLAARPATVSYGRADIPWIDSTNIANPNANEGWPNDGSLVALRARDAATGATIATYVSEPAYPNIVNGPNDLICPSGVDGRLLSTDFPTYLQDYLERRLGGTALVASGTLGDQPGPLQDDTTASPDLPPVDVGGRQCKQTVAFDDAVHMGEILGNVTSEALSSPAARDAAPTVAGAEQYIQTPVYNPTLLALDNVAPLDNGSPWTELGGNSAVAYPTDRSTSPPYETGNLIGTWVTGLRIGGLLLLSEPGEFFPSIHQAWDQAIHGSDGVFVVGMGQDQLGYDFPAYAYPFTYYSADQNLFNPSLSLGDQVVTAGEQDAQALGFSADLTTTAEMTALNNQYLRALSPGVQFLPFPHSGDLAPGQGFTTVLEGFATPPRFDRTTVCNGPVVPSLPSCPLGAPPTIGPIQWSFGDGTRATTDHGTYFSHTYCAAGTYQVTASATDSNGASDHMTLPVTVHPRLVVTIARRGNRLVGGASGGSGGMLDERFGVPGRADAYAASVPLPGRNATVTFTVVDGSGVLAAARATIRGGRVGKVSETLPDSQPFAPGRSTGSTCPAARRVAGHRHARRHTRHRHRSPRHGTRPRFTA